jgi:hypothetical protein
MGYGGKVAEQRRARELRAAGATVPDIAAALGVSKSSVSLWVRDVPTPPMVRRRTRSHTEHPAKVRAREEVAAMDALGAVRLGSLSEQAFLAAGAALYAGEGTKQGGVVSLANTNPDIVTFYLRWLRTFFEIDESRLRARVYLHVEQDLERTTAYWSDLLAVPRGQFRQPHIVQRTAAVRTTKHVHGCVYVSYACTRTHREVMGLVRGLITSKALPG